VVVSGDGQGAARALVHAEDAAAIRVLSSLRAGHPGRVSFSRLGRRVALLVERWVGVHYVGDGLLERADWSHPHHVTLACPPYANLATYDGDYLTRLVLLAHDLALRVEVRPHGPQYVGLFFTMRSRADGFARHHPTIEDVVTEWRARHAEVVA
jgi:hypothetical protein